MNEVAKTYSVQPANRLSSVSEYYFSRKLKEVAAMNAAGKVLKYKMREEAVEKLGLKKR